MVSIAQAARTTGVAVATLRVWERRYGVPCPERTSGGYRNYGPDDLTQIARMRDLVAEGYGPAEAAAVVAAGAVASAGPQRFVERLLETGDVDDLDVDRELAARLEIHDLETVADDWLLPMLAEIGRRWAAGELSVGAEHALTAAVARRLSVLWHELPEGSRTPIMLVGLPAGARHDLTLFCFAVLLRREGFRVLHLGADLPAEAWAEVVADNLPCVVVTASHAEENLAATDELVRAVRSAGAGLVAVGGGRQDLVREPVMRLGHSFAAALDQLSALV